VNSEKIGTIPDQRSDACAQAQLGSFGSRLCLFAVLCSCQPLNVLFYFTISNLLN
jgi:hypothetical protein